MRPRSIGPVILKIIIITEVRFVGAQETANVLNMTSPSNKYRRKYVICFANVLLHSLAQHSPSHLDCCNLAGDSLSFLPFAYHHALVVRRRTAIASRSSSSIPALILNIHMIFYWSWNGHVIIILLDLLCISH